ncbi:C-terminal binding protein [Prosthecobacter sp.]|jgi:D-3-phosphoglycerate dehydrogenase|uniref:C-terminal binding protein n=1 Tax=Prosthecobacter sp. TaxID=1965333 RepID=UPI0037C7DECB
MPKIAITDYTFPDLSLEEAVLRPAGIEIVSFKEKRSPAELAELVRDADAVIAQFAPVNAEVVAAMTKAKVIVRYGIGYDNVDFAVARERGIPVCNIPDYCIDEVADHTLAFILAITRQVVPNALDIRAGKWGLATPLTAMSSLKHLTIGIVGFGRIGREVVKRLLAFKARVLVFDPVVAADEITKAGASVAASFDELLAQSDIVSPHCPSTPKTKQLFNSAVFAKMKAGSIFINVGRGDLADSTAITDALQSGHLAGAALDVFDPEPIPADHPIRTMPNVILAAHIASASPPAVKTLRETAARIALMAVRGEPLPNIVNGVISPR